MPYSQASPDQQQGLLGTHARRVAEQGRRVGFTGPACSDSDRATRSKWAADDLTKVANYVRTQHPDVMQQAVQQQPWLMKAMGNPIVMGALGLIAAKMMKSFTGH